MTINSTVHKKLKLHKYMSRELSFSTPVNILGGQFSTCVSVIGYCCELILTDFIFIAEGSSESGRRFGSSERSECSSIW
jgi:hypothetical protein